MKYVSRISKIKKTTILNIFAICLVLFGLAYALPSLYFKYTNAGTASASPLNSSQVWGPVKSTNGVPLVTGFPVSISIPGPRPAADMNVGIIPGYYDSKSKTWTLTETDAQYAVMTPQPNNITGNTFIYGHYRPNVFAYMHLILPGTIATITTNNGYKFTYKFVETYAVNPGDSAVLANSNSPILTIQTCSGTFFQNRQMYIFTYQGYSKS